MPMLYVCRYLQILYSSGQHITGQESLSVKARDVNSLSFASGHLVTDAYNMLKAEPRLATLANMAVQGSPISSFDGVYDFGRMLEGMLQNKDGFLAIVGVGGFSGGGLLEIPSANPSNLAARCQVFDFPLYLRRCVISPSKAAADPQPGLR